MSRNGTELVDGLDMGPRASLHNVIDGAPPQAKRTGYRRSRVSCRHTFSDDSNIIIGQSCFPVALPPSRNRGARCIPAPLRVAVSSIVGMGAEEEVGGIAARRVVAAVEDKQLIQRDAEYLLHQEAGRGDSPTVAGVEEPVASGIATASPFPAVSYWPSRYESPKALDGRQVVSHESDAGIAVLAPALVVHRAPPASNNHAGTAPDGACHERAS